MMIAGYFSASSLGRDLRLEHPRLDAGDPRLPHVEQLGPDGLAQESGTDREALARGRRIDLAALEVERGVARLALQPALDAAHDPAHRGLRVGDLGLDPGVELGAAHLAPRAGEEVALGRRRHRAVDRALDVDRHGGLLRGEREAPALVADADRAAQRVQQRGAQLGPRLLRREAADVDPVDRHAVGDPGAHVAVEGVQTPCPNEEHGHGQSDDGDQAARHGGSEMVAASADGLNLCNRSGVRQCPCGARSGSSVGTPRPRARSGTARPRRAAAGARAAPPRA